MANDASDEEGRPIYDEVGQGDDEGWISEVEEATILARDDERSRDQEHDSGNAEGMAGHVQMKEIQVVDGVATLVDDKDPFAVKNGKLRSFEQANKFGIKRLPRRAKKALENYMEQGFKNAGKAMIRAGYAPATAHKGEVINKIMHMKPIQQELLKAGVTDKVIAQAIADGLQAMHPKFTDQPDHQSRARFVAEANKVKDNYPAKKIQLDERQVVLNLTGEDVIALKKYESIRDGRNKSSRGDTD